MQVQVGTTQTTSTRMFINTDGNVGIGTADAYVSNLVVSNGGTGANPKTAISTATALIVNILSVLCILQRMLQIQGSLSLHNLNGDFDGTVNAGGDSNTSSNGHRKCRNWNSLYAW